MRKISIAILGLLIIAQSCTSSTGNEPQTEKPSANINAVKVVNPLNDVPVKLGDYWYQGKGEVNHYKLEQNRYKDIHPGEVVMIFVTEDFLTDKQVKNDTYQDKNSTSVLKMNQIRRFSTGIYDYSMMTSVFTPVDLKNHPQTLKVTLSSQDWCGHTFTQLNYKDNAYQYQLLSYFETEGDVGKRIEPALLEDELFNRIRMNPDLLPTGKIKMLPSTTFSRLKHKAFGQLDAVITRTKYDGSDFTGDNLMVYQVKYPEVDRTLEIIYEAREPYAIAGWKDSYPSAFDEQMRTTVATRTNTLMIPYWQDNALENTAMRKDLGLEVNY